jgi:dihydroflavonol-4-reductase
MKALVIGASGHVGNAVARLLLDRQWQVTACGRRREPPLNLTGLPVNYAPGDAERPGQLEEWITGHDLVIDAAAPYPLSVFFPGREPSQDPFVAAERRTRGLIDAILKHGARLAYVGSFVTSVSAATGAQRTRTQMIKWTLPYFEVKQLIESLLLDASSRGLAAVLVNPTYCLGPWDLHDRRVCTIPLLLCGEIPSSINQLLNVIDVRDVAAGLITAVDAERYGEPLPLTGHNISTRDLYNLICALGGVSAPKFATATDLAIVGSFWAEVLFSVFGQQTPIVTGGMMMATAFDQLQFSKVMEELRIRPRPLTETIADAIAWYRAIGYC